MNQAKYRFNRKDGKIYLDREQILTEVGSELRMIILQASEPIWGKPFEHLIAQHWVNLTFIDPNSNYCRGMLSDGTTNALRPWLEYRKLVESKGFELLEVVTTIGFEPIDSEIKWFDYKFSGIAGKPGVADRMRAILSEFQIEPLALK
ncbi:hypothetical protein QUB63_22590 [Microcoleus sp. ARI1-B5]|uniref:hypothetical protein n=1 Tax=unclassified Microcoleus TaxID=2642155 RepID=UPI002FD2191A